MKHLRIACWLLIVCLATCLSEMYANETRGNAKLTQAMVYMSGAELTHEVSIPVKKGENEIIISGLSTNIDHNSIRISTEKGSIVNSFEFSMDYLEKDNNLSALVQLLQDSLDIYKESLEEINDLIKTNQNVLDILQESKDVSDSENSGMTDLIAFIDYFKNQSIDILKEQREYKKTKNKLEESIKRLSGQIRQETGGINKSTGNIKLQLMAPAPGTDKISIVYFTNSARWVPYYDINVLSVNEPIRLAAKAKVMQTTGISWEKVKLSLSSAVPTYGKVAPLFHAWFLDFETVHPLQMEVLPQNDMVVQNSYSYRSSEPDSQFNIRGMSLGDGNNPVIIVNGVEVDKDYLETLDASMVKSLNILKDASSTAMYGSRASNGVVVITLKDSMDDYITQSENEISQSYEIDIPYIIPGNGKAQNVDLYTREIPATFKYYIVPKISTEAYLLAEISDWEKLGLLAGTANITYSGTYMGETFINTQSTQETLALTLGIDKRISVKREKVQDYSGRKPLGNDLKQTFTYQITVKNNHTQPVDMTAKDQYPISTRKEIEVEILKETTPTSHVNVDVGVLVWDFVLAAGETKILRTSYSVKYPKDKNLNF